MTNLSGRVLSNRYRVLNPIGGGGMADVYKVYDESRGAELAIKVLKPQLAQDRVFVEHFRAEAKALRDLDHPNIVRFYSLEQDSGALFIVMDYVDGITLREMMRARGKPLDVEIILEIMRGIYSALEYSHKKGYVHRDIKPTNILVENNKAYVTDFGIAGVSGSSSFALSKAGTPGYMSPEQINNQTPKSASDIYSLGVLLYEMAAGRRPFIGEVQSASGLPESERVRYEHLHLQPPSPRTYNRAISPSFERIILRCLEKDPAMRFRSVSDLWMALKQSPLYISDAPVTEAAKMEPPSQNRRLKNLILTSLAGFVLVFFSLLIYMSRGSIPSQKDSVKTPSSRGMVTQSIYTSAPDAPFSVRPFIFGVDDESMCAWCDLFTATEPGRYYGNVDIPAGSSVVLKMEWCTTSQSLLNENWSLMEYHASFDGYRIDNSQLSVFDKTTGDFHCRVRAGILENLARGEHAYMDVRRFTRQIFDGVSLYKQGDYIFDFTVNVY